MGALAATNYVSIHGHFYQPPRENPFTGEVDGPTDWNERITEECYQPNTRARILGPDGKTRRILNNYGWISFDFGPTLLRWLEDNASGTYAAIQRADRDSVERFGGHGSALAHAYHHIILPLADHRDRVTQVRWGISDFIHRFGRRPEGFWLSETAADTETLRILADEGITYTVLSPYQAAKPVDTRVPYRVDLGDGKRIAVFFYDGPLSQEIAFNGLLDDGRILAKRLTQALGEPTGTPLLANVATDGESYGHHHRFGEMALAVAIEEIDTDPDVTLTNYGQFLSLNPPQSEARIVEGSSWSCSHGLDRWRADCGCSSGAHAGWNQRWRAPLRSALDWLRDSLVSDFRHHAPQLFPDLWSARDHYIEVINGRSGEDFLSEHGVSGLDDGQRTLALGLLDIQHRAMMMFTSCGWFFDDITGPESVIVLRQAGKAIQTTRDLLARDLEPDFLAILEGAPSNRRGLTGREVYESEVRSFIDVSN